MSKTKVSEFVNRGTETAPRGYIHFSDGLRIAYDRNSRDADYDGLLELDQAPSLFAASLTPEHWAIARTWVRAHLTPPVAPTRGTT